MSDNTMKELVINLVELVESVYKDKKKFEYEYNAFLKSIELLENNDSFQKALYQIRCTDNKNLIIQCDLTNCSLLSAAGFLIAAQLGYSFDKEFWNFSNKDFCRFQEVMGIMWSMGEINNSREESKCIIIQI